MANISNIYSANLSLIQYYLNRNQQTLANTLTALASGIRSDLTGSDRAKIDALNAQINGLTQGARNTTEGLSFLQTANSTLDSEADLLIKLQTLAVAAGNSALSTADRASLQTQVSTYLSQFNALAQASQYNGINLLSGGAKNIAIQTGANADDTLSVNLPSISASTIGQYVVNANTGNGTLEAAVSAASSLPSNNNFASQTLTLAGVLGIATTGVLATGSTAYAVAQAVNTITATTGVTATASTTATLSGLSTAGTVSFNLTGENTSSQAISATITSTSDLSTLVTAINNYTADTGISASTSAGTLTLVSSSGYNIGIEDFSVDTAGNQTISFQGNSGAAITLTENGNDSSLVGGRVQFNSPSAFSVTTDTGTTLLNGSTVLASLSALSATDVTTTEGAATALSVITASLQTINAIQATLGAYEAGLTASNSSTLTTITSLGESLDHLQNVDLASALAQATKAQLLQTSGIYALRQATDSQKIWLSLFT